MGINAKYRSNCNRCSGCRPVTAGCDVINHIEMFHLRKVTCLRTISGNTCTIVSTLFLILIISTFLRIFVTNRPIHRKKLIVGGLLFKFTVLKCKVKWHFNLNIQLYRISSQLPYIACRRNLSHLYRPVSGLY